MLRKTEQRENIKLIFLGILTILELIAASPTHIFHILKKFDAEAVLRSQTDQESSLVSRKFSNSDHKSLKKKSN